MGMTTQTIVSKVVAYEPDAEVVTEPAAREAILQSGHPWHIREDRAGIELLLVPAGSYLRGSGPDDPFVAVNERPQHRVIISRPFYLGRYPVTQGQWFDVIGANPSLFDGRDRPVEQVSWQDASTFLQQTGLRFPADAEWEYACRAGVEGALPEDLDAVAWHGGNASNRTHDVGTKAANPWGFHDMHGNVFEWCADGDGDGDGDVEACRGSLIDPLIKDGNARTVRGGSWLLDRSACRPAYFLAFEPTLRNCSLGLRVAAGV